MNLYVESLKKGFKNGTLLLLVYVAFAVFVNILSGNNGVDFLFSIDFYINMLTNPLIVGVFIILVIVFSIISLVKLKKSD
ncbi:hypothetical protein GCM10025767_27630 [Thalassotalea piscium]|uniref:Uncharacterized protein HemY n=1 Tax=Thalassotalea piscium TaxID=1230533 RepID=A0A7X0NKC3_9GAMM|nr:uncharacterized protein HemY [Thalassotalea piscium]